MYDIRSSSAVLILSAVKVHYWMNVMLVILKSLSTLYKCCRSLHLLYTLHCIHRYLCTVYACY